MRRISSMKVMLQGKLKLWGLVVAGLILAGCQSKNPMDYLPQSSGGYVGLNMAAIRQGAGLKRLTAEMEKMQAGSTDFASEKAQKVYLAFDLPADASTAPPIYGMAVGSPGFADEVVERYKAHGATEAKTAGHATYTSGPVTVSPVGDTGILVFQNPSMLERMVAVSKKKEPGAQASSVFNYVESQLNDYAVVTAGNAQPLITMATPLLATMEAREPKAVAAVKEVTMVSLAFNWDVQPVLELIMHMADKTKAEALANTFNTYITMLKYTPILSGNPDVAKVVSPLKATVGENGVKLRVEIPADVADRLFEQLGNMPQQGEDRPAEFMHRE